MAPKEMETKRHIILCLSQYSSDTDLVTKEHIKNFVEKLFKKSHGRNLVFGSKITLKSQFQKATYYERNSEAFCIRVTHLFFCCYTKNRNTLHIGSIGEILQAHKSDDNFTESLIGNFLFSLLGTLV